jgi:hypothetical protein
VRTACAVHCTKRTSLLVVVSLRITTASLGSYCPFPDGFSL